MINNEETLILYVKYKGISVFLYGDSNLNNN